MQPKKILVLSLVYSLSFVLLLWLLTFMSNFSMYIGFWNSNLSFWEKLVITLQILPDGLVNVILSLNGLLTFVLVILQAFAITTMVYAKKYAKAKTVCRLKGSQATGTVATIIAFVGVGCPTCGTSLLTPLIAFFVSGLSATASNLIGNLLIILSCLLVLFAIFNLLYQLHINHQ